MKNIKRVVAALILIILILAIATISIIMRKSQVNIEIPAEEEKTMVTVGEYQEFGCTEGVQTYTAPVMGVYKLEVWGAQGVSINGYSGGKGGYSVGNITLNKDSILYVVVGNDNGYNGGGVISKSSQGKSTGQNGGGATHIATTNRGELKNYVNNKNEVIIVAGGGGGALYGFDTCHGPGGSGGGLTGGMGTEGDYAGGNYLGTGGTQDKPGDSIGSPYEDSPKAGFGYGAGGGYLYAGGGGGWYGGGNTYYYGGGAGGSGYIGGVTSGTTQNGVQSGNGYARITLMEITDTTPPTCTITANTADTTNASSITYTFTFSEEVYNFVSSDISVTNGTITNFWGSGANYAMTVTNTGTCNQTVSIGANVCNDFAGNGNTAASKSITIDRTPPIIKVNPASGGYTKSRNITITIEETGGAGLNGSNNYQYYLSNSSTGLGDGTWTNYENGGTYTIGAGKSGEYYLFVRRISDNVGNVSTSGGAVVAIGGETFQRFGPYYFDNTKPTCRNTNYETRK